MNPRGFDQLVEIAGRIDELPQPIAFGDFEGRAWGSDGRKDRVGLGQ
jgi:hypothetical protein